MIHPIPVRYNLNSQDSTGEAVFPMTGATIASVTASPQGAVWGTAVLTPKWSNDRAGPWFAFLSSELSATTIPAGGGGIGWINVEGKGFLAIVVTTPEGAEEYATVTVSDNREIYER